MPDTGAPWNIPYAAPADLVRDWPDLSEDVADAVAAGLSAAGNAGIGSNVVQFVKTDTQTISGASSGTYDVIGGGTNNLEVSITPSSDTSRVLVLALVAVAQAEGGNANEFLELSLFRGSTNLAVPTSPGSRTPGMSGANQGSIFGERAAVSLGLQFLDSPATAASVTYSVRGLRNTSGTTFINRSTGDTDTAGRPRFVSTIVAIEVAP